MTRGDRQSGTYNSLENMPWDEQRAKIWDQVISLISFAWKSSREFKDRAGAAGLTPGDIASYEDFTAVPPLSKKALIRLQEDNFQSLVNTPLGKLSRVYVSPGPLYDPEGRKADYWGWTEAFYAAGFREEDLVQMTFSYHLTPAGLMLEEPLRNLGCAVVPAGPGNSSLQAEIMAKLKVSGFVGMASFLKIIGDKGRKNGWDLQKDFNLQVAFVAAEKLSENMRRELEQDFDMIVRQGYGTADVGCIAYECPELTGMHVSTRCLVEICEPGTGRPLPFGEAGEVVVTPLNTTYPLIRLATGDLSRMVQGDCGCGRSSPRLQGILGRTDTTAKVKGQFLYPHQVDKVMEECKNISAWQVIITNPGGRDTLTLKIEARGEVDEKEVISRFQSVLKLRPAIELCEPEGGIPRDAPVVDDQRTWEE